MRIYKRYGMRHDGPDEVGWSPPSVSLVESHLEDGG